MLTKWNIEWEYGRLGYYFDDVDNKIQHFRKQNKKWKPKKEKNSMEIRRNADNISIWNKQLRGFSVFLCNIQHLQPTKRTG